jgi:ketosteroid isomerase-like protein
LRNAFVCVLVLATIVIQGAAQTQTIPAREQVVAELRELLSEDSYSLAIENAKLSGAAAQGLLREPDGELEKDNVEAQQAYRDYVEAWKLKDITALENVISADYMAVDFHGKVSGKENEIATAKADAEWTSMTVEEIHTRIFGKTAIASGFISAQGKSKDGNIVSAKVRFLGVLIKQGTAWRLVATQSTSFKPVPAR